MSFRRDSARFGKLDVVEQRFAGIMVQTLTGHTTIQANGPSVLVIDPGGAARNLLMPPEADCEGKLYILVNAADAAENISWQNDAGGAIGTVGQNEAGMAIVVAGVWRLLGVMVA